MLLWQFNGCQYSKARSDRAVLSPTSVQAPIQEILPAYILSSPRRKPGSISPGHVPSRVSKALPLPENSGTAARWVPAFAGTTREYLIIPASMPISSHALSRGDEEKSLAESSVCAVYHIIVILSQSRSGIGARCSCVPTCPYRSGPLCPANAEIS